MKRNEQIDRLVAVGFSKPELTRKSNLELGAVYDAARPLMSQHREEMDQVRKDTEKKRRAEQKHRENIQRQRAHEDAQRSLEIEWRRNWKPARPISIRSLDQDVKTVLGMIDQCIAKAAEFAEMFRVSGDRSHANSANVYRQHQRDLEQEFNKLTA